ncbi:DUF4365 domain-containing protein [Maribacter aestuarii]|uniref:DUF4365 domain-containing protein n=1 Tax=Maribacter aestuarii TaxID=1130723 RepID=UPI0025A53E1B|nr:DUF4365 domain-containing protein [Maribacter aestuarii]
MNNDLDELQFPKSSRNIDLETISENFFRPLFPPEKFILKKDPVDNGIDFKGEIKRNSNILGFGFNFQLKSSETIDKNGDGSYSKSVETSNIEYLINSGQPSFYGFYSEKDNSFYYEHLQDFIQDLSSKDKNWQNQKTHTLRFIKKLTKDGVENIYTIVFEQGLTTRLIRSKLAEKSNSLQFDEKIIIDYKGNVSNDDEIKRVIEEKGLQLNNQSKWLDVIELHKKTSVSLIKSSKYNLILGISYFYRSEYYKSLDFLKQSKNKIEDLDENLRGHLIFFYVQIRHLLGIINNEEYQSELKGLNDSGGIKSYLKLEEILELRKEMYTGLDSKSEEFESKIQSYISDESITSKMKVLAECHLSVYYGEKLLNNLASLIISEQYAEINQYFSSINKDFRRLLLKAESLNSDFDIYYIALNQNRFLLHFNALCDLLFKPFFEKELLDEILQSIKKAFTFYEKIGHIDNELFSLSVLLEYYKYTNQNDEEDKIKLKLETYLKIYDAPDLVNRINFTRDGGTFIHTLSKKKEKYKKEAEKIKELRDEMIEFDENEKEFKREKVDSYHINLFPMGYFEIPKKSTEILFDILNIDSSELKNRLRWFFEEGIVPVANTYVEKIVQEGSLNGNMEYKGFKSYENMHRIRKGLFQNKFYRTNNYG